MFCIQTEPPLSSCTQVSLLSLKSAVSPGILCIWTSAREDMPTHGATWNSLPDTALFSCTARERAIQFTTRVSWFSETNRSPANQTESQSCLRVRRHPHLGTRRLAAVNIDVESSKSPSLSRHYTWAQRFHAWRSSTLFSTTAWTPPSGAQTHLFSLKDTELWLPMWLWKALASSTATC